MRVYNCMVLDLKDGPLVIETPPNILGIINDSWFDPWFDKTWRPGEIELVK
jgi:hypothetical protein